MRISKLNLENFRNFKAKSFVFAPGSTVLVGPNASGKTNILESIYLISTGKSFKAKLEEEMINYRSDLSRVECVVNRSKEEKDDLEVVLTRGEIRIGIVKYQKIARKRMLINGIGKRLIDFSGFLKTSLFGPWDLGLVTESPSVRRKFLDNVLSQVDREYRRATLSYEKGLRQRNRLLLRIREEGLPRSQLLFWDRLLIKNGDYISKKRFEFIDYINSTPSLKEQIFTLVYDKSAISQSRLEQYAYEEVAAATTLVGPHRDDIIFKISDKKKSEGRDLGRFGSRGEQRMGVLWLKVGELNFIEEETLEKPVLLLDDIFSELDHDHREVVFDISSNQQTIITTADIHHIKGVENLELIKII